MSGIIISNLINIYKMTAQEDYSSIQRRLLDIYERGHLMGPEQLNRAIDGITGQALQMVRRRRQEYVPPPPPQVSQIRIGYAHRINSGPYTAPLRGPIQRRNPLEKTVTIKKAEFDALCTDSCAICFENHKKGDTVMTECSHQFGKQCYNRWMTSVGSNHKCPTCRKEMPRVTSYKTRCKKPVPFIIEEEPEEPMIF